MSPRNRRPDRPDRPPYRRSPRASHTRAAALAAVAATVAASANARADDGAIPAGVTPVVTAEPVAPVPALPAALLAFDAAPPPPAPAVPPGGALFVDVAPAPVRPDRGRWLALGGLGGLFAGLTAYTYFAWYFQKPQLPEFTVDGDGWFGPETYAGGADKLGHLWGNLLVARGTTALLRSGGWSRLAASLMGSGMTLAFFTYVEIKDGYYYQFSTGDMVGNVVGAGLSALMTNVPRVDELLDFRVEYVPSAVYLDNLSGGDINALEDYSGQTYYLALHLSGLRGLARSPYLGWTEYVDLVAGFETRNYKPDPIEPGAPRRQRLFAGVSLNMQHLLGELLGPDTRARRSARTIGHAVFEFVNVPYTTLPVADAVRSPDER